MLSVNKVFNKSFELFKDIKTSINLGDIKPLSFKAVDTYLTCPRKYNFSYLQTIVGEASDTKTSASQNSGMVLYKVVTNVLKESYKSGSLCSLENMLSVYDRLWVSAVFNNPADASACYEEGKNIISKFYEKNSSLKERVAELPSWKNKNVKVPALEVKANADIGGVKIIERIDRIMSLPDGSYEVIVYKLSSAWGLQSRAASLYTAAKKLFPSRKISVVFYLLRENMKLSVDLKKEAIRQFEENVKSVATGIARREFAPVKGQWCSFCSFRASCSVWKGFIPDKTRMRLSFSKFNMYLTCPRQYRLVYVDKIRLKPHSFFSLGTSVHEAFEKFYTYDGIMTKPSLRALLSMLKESWKSEGYEEDGVSEREYYKRAVDMLTSYYKSFVAGVAYKKAYRIEEYFELQVGEKALFTGFIDRIDELDGGKYEIIDYKTEPTWPNERIMEDHKLQLAIYWLACKEGHITSTPPVKLSLFFLNFDKKITFDIIGNGSGAVSGIDISRIISENIKLVDETVEKIRASEILYKKGSSPDEVFMPRQNDYCHNCDFKMDCPLFII